LHYRSKAKAVQVPAFILIDKPEGGGPRPRKEGTKKGKKKKNLFFSLTINN
jgi:hypothetical protein